MAPAKVIGFCRHVIPEVTCYKVPYDTKQQAHAIIATNKGRKKRKECKVYFCEECKAWHLTSQRSNK